MSNQGIAWQYNYALKMFKDTFKVWIKMHSQIVQGKKPLTVMEVMKTEETIGIVMPMVANNLV